MRPSGAVAVTGVGAVSALGRGVGALTEALFAGRHGVAALDRFDPSPFGRRAFAAAVPGGGGAVAYAVEAAREAFAMAGGARHAPGRVAVVVGTSLGRKGDVAAVALAVARALGAGGPAVTFSTACTSSANAVGFARDLLARGDADLCIAGGADELSLDLFAGFAALGVLAEGPCAPFGPVTGTTLGEGAGFVALEREGEGGTAPLAYLHGYGLASDAWHETSPDPRGAGVARAIRSALADAGWSPADVDYVNAHATGTAANDEAEWLGTEAALGARAGEVPVSASKSFLGHAQGAAGALELIATLACVERGCVPPSMRAGAGRKRGPADAVAGEVPRAHRVGRFLATSSAFGGANAVLAVGRSPGVVGRRADVAYLVGFGEVTSPADVALARSDAGLRARAPSADPRALDPLARLVLTGCALALDDAGPRPSGEARDRAGVVLGARRVSWASARAWQESLTARGVTRVSAAAFARLVLHAAAGSASKALSLRGAASTVGGGAAAGLAAVAYAADLVATRGDLDLCVAGGADEDEHARPEAEGAAFAAIGRSPRDGALRVGAVAFAGPGAWREAAERAAGAAGVAGAVEWVAAPRTSARAATEGALALAAAARAVRGGARFAGAVAWDEGAACAVLLAKE